MVAENLCSVGKGRESRARESSVPRVRGLRLRARGY